MILHSRFRSQNIETHWENHSLIQLQFIYKKNLKINLKNLNALNAYRFEW